MKGRRRELQFSRGCRLQILVLEGGDLGGGKFAGPPTSQFHALLSATNMRWQV